MAAQDIAKKDPFKTPPRVDDDDDDDDDVPGETVEKKAFPKRRERRLLSAKRRSSFAVRVRDAIIEPIFSGLSRRAALRLLRCDACTMYAFNK